MGDAAEKPTANDLYETDFYAWTKAQAVLLRDKRWSDRNLENLVDEIDSVGGSQKKEIRSPMQGLLVHLLKWSYQANFRGHSWRRTIWDQRKELSEEIADSPSLRPCLLTTRERC